MNCFPFKRTTILFSAIVMGLQPCMLLANPPALKSTGRTANETSIRIVDVAIDSSGNLNGNVFNVSGKSIAGAQVLLRKDGREIGKTSTSKDGQFGFPNVSGGVYQLETASGVSCCRLWTNKAAPPSAAKRILIVEGSTLARGQHPISELTGPIVVGSLIAAAIVIPVAIHDARGDDDTGS